MNLKKLSQSCKQPNRSTAYLSETPHRKKYVVRDVDLTTYRFPDKYGE